LAERATDAEISEFLSKITSSLKSKMELFDDIVKIKLNSNYPSLLIHYFRNNETYLLEEGQFDFEGLAAGTF
jgi:F0F1-type ATP synthase delta subunit